MSWRVKQRLKILSIIFIIFIFLFIYFFEKTKPEPTCFDGIKNQGELGVDCGGPCPPCRLFELKEIKVQDILKFDYRKVLDVLVILLNENPDYGIENFKVTLEFLKEGVVLAKFEKSIFINPGQRKYVTFYNLPLNLKDYQISVKLEKQSIYNWKSPKIFPSQVNFDFLNTTLSQEGSFYSLEGQIYNKTNLDFDNLKLIGFLLDDYETILSFNEYDLGSIRGFEKKNFKFLLFKPLIQPKKQKIIVDVNLF